MTALGSRYSPGLKFKISVSLLLFIISFSIKSLQAVDVSPLMYTRSQPAGGMGQEYDREARAIVASHSPLLSHWDASDTSLLGRAPGYGIYLSAIYTLRGDDFFTVQVIQNALNSLSPILIFLIAGSLLTWPVGAVSGLLAAVSHHFAYYSTLILPDSLCALPILAAIYLLVRSRHGHSRPWPIIASAGALIGLAVWLRPNALLLGPFMACLLVLIAKNRRQEARRAWAVAVVPFLVILPVTIRNYLIYHEFVPVSENMGIVLWEGIANQSGDRFGAVGKDGEVAAQEAVLYNDPRYGESWATPDGIKRDRDRIQKSMAIIVRHPVWFVGTMAHRMKDMVAYVADAPLVYRNKGGEAEAVRPAEEDRADAPPMGDDADNRMIYERDNARRHALAYGEHIAWARPVARAFQRIAKETTQLFIFLGAPLALFLSLRRGTFILIVPLYYLLIQSTMHTEFRYTLPIHYFLFVFAAIVWVLIGAGVVRMARRLAGPNRREWVDRALESDKQSRQ